MVQNRSFRFWHMTCIIWHIQRCDRLSGWHSTVIPHTVLVVRFRYGICEPVSTVYWHIIYPRTQGLYEVHLKYVYSIVGCWLMTTYLTIYFNKFTNSKNVNMNAWYSGAFQLGDFHVIENVYSKKSEIKIDGYWSLWRLFEVCKCLHEALVPVRRNIDIRAGHTYF